MINWTNFLHLFFSFLLRKKASFKLCIFSYYEWGKRKLSKELEPYRSFFLPHFHSLFRVTTFYSSIEKKQKPFSIWNHCRYFELQFNRKRNSFHYFNNNYFCFCPPPPPSTIFYHLLLVHRSVNVSNFHFVMNYKKSEVLKRLGEEFHFKNMTWII